MSACHTTVRRWHCHTRTHTHTPLFVLITHEICTLSSSNEQIHDRRRSSAQNEPFYFWCSLQISRQRLKDWFLWCRKRLMQTNSPALDVFRVGCKYVHRTSATSVFEVWCEICSCAHLCCFICCHLLPLWSSPSCCAELPCSGAHTRIKNRAKQKHVRFDRIYHSSSDCCHFLVPVMEFQRPLSQGAVKFCGENVC